MDTPNIDAEKDPLPKGAHQEKGKQDRGKQVEAEATIGTTRKDKAGVERINIEEDNFRETGTVETETYQNKDQIGRIPGKKITKRKNLGEILLSLHQQGQEKLPQKEKGKERKMTDIYPTNQDTIQITHLNQMTAEAEIDLEK